MTTVGKFAAESGLSEKEMLRMIEQGGFPQRMADDTLSEQDQDLLRPLIWTRRGAAAIRALRKSRGLSRAQLAAAAGVSERQLARIEAEEIDLTKAEEQTNRLAQALHVTVDDMLFGRTERVRRALLAEPGSAQTMPVGAPVSALTRLGFALVRLRYGLSVGQVLELTPLMFALLAEGSLVRRKRRLKQLKDAYSQVKPELKRYLSDFRERRDAEARSISRRDLRDAASLFRIPAKDEGGDGEAPASRVDNGDDFDPFSTYLFELARGLSDGDEPPVRPQEPPIRPHEWRSTERQLLAWMFREEMERIAGKSEKARWALEYGDVNLFDLPEELREDLEKRRIVEEPDEKMRRIERRINWLESRLSPEIEGAIRRWRDEWSDRAEGETP